MAEALAAPLETHLVLIVGINTAGLAEDTKAGVRLTPAGRKVINKQMRGERAAADPAQLESSSVVITPVNSAFKQLITRWQRREVDARLSRNEHSDPVCDKAVCDAFDPIHGGVANVIDAVARTIP